ncbi:MAG: PilZ domain-containing protein [Planctomycetota bacterium]|nr:PilZ domain-containing protein [Planctomycetota bacterium]
MSDWLSRLRNALQGRPDGAVDVRKTLLAAQRSRARIELEPLRPTATLDLVLATTIEQVHRDAFVISQPVMGGTVRPLARYEPYHLSFTGPDGRTTGQTHALGRTRVRAGGGGMIYGYRLALPEALYVIDPRRELRMLLEEDLVVEAELQVLERRVPVQALVQDLSPSGACLRCRHAEAPVRKGGQAQLRLKLPEPIGELIETVNVVSVEREADAPGCAVRVLFEKKNQAIAAALRDTSRLARSERRSA